MGIIEDLKWWHWIVISLLIGFALGYMHHDTEPPDDVHSLTKVGFEQGILSPQVQDVAGARQSRISNILILSPVQDAHGKWVQQVRFTYLVFHGRDNDRHAVWEAEPYIFMAPVPFEPSAQRVPGGQPSPGCTSYTGQAGDTLESVTAKVYSEYSPAGYDAIRWANVSLQTADRNIYAGRMYNIPWNPKEGRTIKDFLDAAAKDCPWITYHKAWWLDSKMSYVVWMGGSFVVVGLIWPMLINLLTGAGFGRPKEEKGIDLSKVRNTPSPMAARPVMTKEDEDQLKALEAQLTAALKDSKRTTEKPPVSESVPVKKLDGAAEPATVEVPAPTEPEKPFDRAKYTGGIYYPVQRGPKPASNKPPGSGNDEKST